MDKEFKYASFWRRLFASSIDSFILMAIGMGISSALGRDPFNFKEIFETIEAGTPVNTLTTLDYALTLFISAFFILFFWVKHNGQTPGKKALHIKIIKEDGSALDGGTAIIRYLSYFVSSIALFLGCIWVIFDKRKQAWHDKIAKTLVIEADNQKPSKAIYALACLLPILFIVIYGGAIFLIGIKKLETPTNVALRKYTTAVKEMSPEAKKHWDRSQELFSQMRELQKRENEPGVVDQIKKLNDENIAELKKAIEAEPDNARIWAELGAAYTWISSKGSLEDSYLAYKKAADLEPNNVVYNNFLGDSLISLGKYEEAILVYQKTIRQTDKNGYAFQGLGIAYENLKVYDEARKYYQKALDTFISENKEGEFDKKILEIQKALARLPKGGI